jgi:hypothetical protein
MKHLKLHILIVGCLISNLVCAQISGVINSYYQVTDFVPTYNGLRVLNVTGLANLDRVLIIQMKGATINSNNSAAFGDLVSIGDAGKYEFATICGFLNDTVIFEKQLLNTYDYSQSVQLIRIPVYNDVTINGTLLPQPWNPVTGTGGVVALIANGVITLNADVNADGAGYRGGTLYNFASPYTCVSTSASDYFFSDPIASPGVFNPIRVNNGAEKGEGIAPYVTGRKYGKGKQANGGGGGNNHNTGGGGGANYGSGGSGGTLGGTSSSCGGDDPGLGGLSLSGQGYSILQNRIFLGGGGGAGHQNNSVGTSGGNGGGIVFIQALEIVGNGRIISAKGTMGTNASNTIPQEATGDGGGGGGAGGTILLNVLNYTSALQVDTRGATGSNSGFVNLCSGPGGGGGGGVVWSNLALPLNVTASVNGGANGTIRAGVSCAGSNMGAASGNNGVIQNGFQIPEGADFNCASVLSVEHIRNWKGVQGLNNVHLSWRLMDASNLYRLDLERKIGYGMFQRIKTYSNPEPGSFNYTDYASEFPSIYRLVLVAIDGRKTYSTQLQFRSGSNSVFQITPNPVVDQLSIQLPFSGMRSCKLSVSDSHGKVVYLAEQKMVQGQSGFRCNVKDLSAGVYYLQCVYKGERYTAKFIKL